MLEQKDLQAIGKLLDEKLDERFQAQDRKFDERFQAQDCKFDEKFQAQDRKFDERFQAQDRKFDEKFDEKFQAQDRKFDEKFDEKFQAQDRKFDEKFDEKFQAQDRKFDEKFDEKFQAQDRKFDEKLDKRFDEIIEIINEGFTGIQEQIDGLKSEMAKRPTRNEIFRWADERIINLELARDRHDFMHINELGKLPSQAEISQALMDRGFKQNIKVK
ncbi:MAG: hypothetical protein V1667_03280 [bacterium]